MESSGMKYRVALAISLFALGADSYATTLCQEKGQDIQRKISYVEERNSQSRINRLNKALSEVRANYTDSELRANHQKKIAGRKSKIAERQRGLAKAKQKGDAEKIAKRKHKLAKAQQELRELETRDY